MVWFVILTVITVGLALGLPPDPQTLHNLHITSLAYRAAIAVLLIPFGIIWYSAFYAFAKLSEYSRAIKDTADGKAFQKVMMGAGVLAFGLIVPTIITLILQNIAIHHPHIKPAITILSNYLSIAVVIVTFAFIGVGARYLSSTGDLHRPSLIGTYIFSFVFIILSVLFTYLVMHFHVHHPNIYYLNTGFLLSTFVVPYLFGWCMALFGAYEFWLYAKHVKGLLYRQALQQFAYGITVVICGSITVQFVDNTIAARATHSLGAILILEYIMFTIVGVGLVLMAMGTKKLKKFEEV